MQVFSHNVARLDTDCFLLSLLYTVMKRPEKCFQCLQIWRRHENALQFRIGACVKNIDQVRVTIMQSCVINTQC